jgi:hypothetical protein
MTRRQVSEKTLELNVTAEILQTVRQWPGFEGVFWIGMKQYQERVLGVDEVMKNLPSGHHLFLQFKSPVPTPPNTEPYRYKLNAQQRERLLLLARRYPGAIWYVFPNYNTLLRVRHDSPTLAMHTYLLPVTSTAHLQPARSHTARCWEDPAWVDLRSQPSRERLFSLKALFSDEPREWLGESPADRLVPNEEVASWLRRDAAGPNESPYRIGQRLRGLSTLFFPSAE